MNTKTTTETTTERTTLSTLAYYWRFRVYFFLIVPKYWLQDNGKSLFLLAFLLLGLTTMFMAMALPFMHTTLGSISGPIASMMMFTAGCCITQHAAEEIEAM